MSIQTISCVNEESDLMPYKLERKRQYLLTDNEIADLVGDYIYNKNDSIIMSTFYGHLESYTPYNTELADATPYEVFTKADPFAFISHIFGIIPMYLFNYAQKTNSELTQEQFGNIIKRFMANIKEIYCATPEACDEAFSHLLRSYKHNDVDSFIAMTYRMYYKETLNYYNAPSI